TCTRGRLEGLDLEGEGRVEFGLEPRTPERPPPPPLRLVNGGQTFKKRKGKERKKRKERKKEKGRKERKRKEERKRKKRKREEKRKEKKKSREELWMEGLSAAFLQPP
ncbi:cbf5, partial [Ophiophagus hannah]